MRPIRTILLVVLLLFLSGCASMGWRTGNLPPLPSWPPAGVQEKRSVRLLIAGEKIEKGKTIDLSIETLELWQNSLV